MSLRFPNNATQSRVEHDVGADDDLVGQVSVLAWTYFDTNSSNVHYLWKNAHARGFGRVGAQLYFKMNGASGLHEAQSDNALFPNLWHCVAFSYDFTTSNLLVCAATLGNSLAAVNLWYNSNTRVGMETNVSEPQICGSRQAAYNYDRNWDNPVSVMAVWWEALTLADLQAQQYKLWAAVQPAKLHFITRYGLGAVTDPQPDLGPNGYHGTPYNAVAGPLMPTALFELYQTVTGTAALSGAGSLATAGLVTVSGATVLAGAGSLTADGLATVNGAAALSGAGSLAAAGTVTVGGRAALSGAGSLTAAGLVTVSGAAVLVGAGTLTAASSYTVTGGAALVGASSLVAAGTAVAAGQAALVGSGALIGAGLVRIPGQATLAGTGAILAVALVTIFGRATLGGAGQLSAAGGLPGWNLTPAVRTISTAADTRVVIVESGDRVIPVAN